MSIPSKVCFLLFSVFVQLDCEIYEDRPRIRTNDGDLILRPALDKNVYILPNGPKSSVFIGDIDILRINTSNSKPQVNPAPDPDINQKIYGSNGILSRLTRLENLNPQPSIGPILNITYIRRRLIRLSVRISNLETQINNIKFIDKCQNNPCKNGGTCLNLASNYHCLCPANWEGTDCDVDVNECRNFAGTDLGCQNGATCLNKIGSYECLCRNGWFGMHCTRKAKDCSGGDFEMCGHGICLPVPTGDGIKCICDQGWMTNGTGVACTTDVNECDTKQGSHCSVNPKVDCINLPGSFRCGQCPNGYEGDGFTCSDINECVTIPNGGCSTSPMVACHNTIGSRICGSCPMGYQGDGVTCTWRGSCNINRGGCHPSAQCIENSSQGGQPAQCICPEGMEGDGVGLSGCSISTADNSTNRCGNNPCGTHGQCHPLRSGYTCICFKGYGGAHCDAPFNVCGPNMCRNGGTCRPDEQSPRGFRCECTAQFSGDFCQTMSKACGGVLNAEEGSIAYPPNNSSYSDNSRCAWVIHTNPEKVINVTFSKFNLEPEPDCVYDFLQIHDGRNSGSQLIGRFCGNTFPKGGNIISSHNFLYFWFRSDQNVAKDGFALHWNSIPPVCGGKLDASKHGHISSPGSPGKYPPNRDCYWILSTDLGKRIQLHFFNLDIESHSNCSFDYLAIYDGEHTTDPLLQKFCNSTQPEPIRSASSDLLIHFHSDAFGSGNGFQIVYAPTEGLPGCGGYFTEEKGEISSPSFNGKYLHNLLCEYKIKTSQGTKIAIKIKSFNLENSFKCQYDYLKIYDGSSTESPLVGKFCGSNYIKYFTSSSNYLFIKLKTDNSMASDGFVLTYESVCQQTFLGDSGVIKSPGYPFSYPENRVCEYLIQTEPGKSIQLTFQDFDIEYNRHVSDCRYDNVEIRDGLDSNSTLLGRYCGGSDHTPPVQTSTHNYIYVRFNSDRSVSGTGFYANYTTIVTNCGGIHKDAQGTIDYPLNTQDDYYENSATCTWLLVAPEGMHIKLVWNSFNIEMMPSCQSDYVEITEIEYTNEQTPLGKFCGDNLPPALTTFSNRLRIKFVSDDSVQDKGFSVSYSFLNEKQHCGGNYLRTHGNIMSPGWPGLYEPNKDCTWVISVPFGQQIMLNISFFDLERSIRGTCELGDFLEIRNGLRNDSPLLGKYCGSSSPRIIKSIANSLFIHFHSDFYLSGKGFLIEWDSTVTGCGGTLTGSSGSISSPNYPLTYDDNAECFYRIVSSAGSRIEINFVDLELEYRSNCEDDYIEIFDGRNTDSPRLGRFCNMSQLSNKVIETSSNYAYITFRSDFYIAEKGFLLNYHTICKNNMTDRYGVIESPGFPNNYPKNLDCLWKVQVPRGNKINITFTHFDIYKPLRRFIGAITFTNSCDQDFLQIKELIDDSFKDKLCGYTLPKSFTSNTNSLMFKFVSISYFPRTGFRLEWVNNGCGGHMKKKFGSITFDKNFMIEDDLVCEWLIETNVGTSVEVHITRLFMTESQNCSIDALELYNGDNTNYPLVTKICHSGITAAHASSNLMLIRFVKKSSLKNAFFTLNFQGIQQTCGGRMISRSGMIHSKNYPQNYDNNINCIWYINVPANHIIELEFIDLDLFSDDDKSCEDNIKIYEHSDYSYPNHRGTNYSYLICPNSNITQIISKTNNIEIEFVTDGSRSAKGFKANFSMICGATITANYDGMITNDNYVNFFNNSCSWTIIAPDLTDKISLTITHISIPKTYRTSSNRNCPESFLKIFDGNDKTAPLIDEYCGRKIPPMIVSHGNSITIQFGSYSNSLSGKFMAHYSRTKSACGGSLFSEEGTIASPNYPQSYPGNSDCEWIVQTSPGNRVYIVFEQFDIDYSEDCNEDYVEVRENSRNGGLLGVYCGTEIPSNTTVASKLFIKLHSDNKNSGRGFMIHYGFVHENYISDMEKGEIASPLYPHSYIGSSQYSWRISTSGSSPIDLKIMLLEIPVQGSSCYNYLAIYDGYDESSSLIDTLCGLLPDQKVSYKTTSSIVYLKLSLDTTNTGSLFRLKWAKSDEDPSSISTDDEFNCGSNTTQFISPSQSFQIKSPNYPEFYNNSLNCKWTFQSSPDRHLSLIIKDLKLEETSKCFADYISVDTSDSGLEWSSVKNKICLYSQSQKSIVGKSFMLTKFTSDYAINERGFRAEVYSLCGGNINALFGVISPSFYDWKNLFKSDNKCEWTITARPGKTIVARFEHFNITNNDECFNYVTIRNGNSFQSPLLGNGKYCGYSHENISEIISSGNSILVTYNVLRRTSFQNFRLHFEEKSFECGLASNLDSKHNFELINSPNFPSIPAPFSECVWTFYGPPGEILRIDFIDRFDLDHKDDCTNEFVEIRDGSSQISPLKGRYCEQKPGTIKTTGNVVYIKYVTQLSEPRNGFKANVSIDVCGGTIQASTGELSSPGYPHMQFLAIGTVCEWHVIGTPGHIFKIVIQNINLPDPETSCATKLIIDEANPVNKTTNTLKTFCSDDYLDDIAPIETSENMFIVRLIIGKSHEWSSLSDKQGFRLTFNSTMPTCSGTITSPEGYITTPGYPRPTNLRYCQWFIKVPNKNRRVTFKILDYDNNMIGIFNDLHFQSIIKTISEKNLNLTNNTFESSSNTMAVYIMLAPFASKHRFKAKFSSDEEALCGGTMAGLNGSLLSPLLEKSYFCRWHYNYVNDKEVNNQNVNALEYNTMFIEGRINSSLEISGWNRRGHCFVKPKLNIISVTNYRGLPFKREVCTNTDFKYIIPSTAIDLTAFQLNHLFLSFELKWKLQPCGGVVHVTESSLNILNIPQGYNDSIECAWLLISSTDSRMSITLEGSFLLPCTEEFIKISDMAQYGPTIGDYCVDRSQQRSITTNRVTYVQYHSNIKQNTSIKVVVQKTTKQCGGLLLKYDNIFSSPNYPKNYQENIECRWEIVTDIGNKISLQFIDRFVVESRPNCTKDAVIIFDWVNNTYIEIARLCGRQAPTAPFNSTSNKMMVVLRTDSEINLDGFRALWKPICGIMLQASDVEQFIYSPGYPFGYNGLLDCKYEITTKPKQEIDFKVLDFELEGTFPSCDYDNFTLSFGDYVYQTYCGKETPSNFNSFSHIIIDFKTDRFIQKKGFKLSFKLYNCNKIITEPTVLTSGPGSEYSGNMNCTWSVEAPVNKIAVIKLFFLDVESSAECLNDYLAIYNGNTIDKNHRIALLCGLINSTSVLYSKDRKMLIQFVTDDSLSFTGFRAEVYFTFSQSVGCGGSIDLQGSTIINSPLLPGEVVYTNYLDCQWTITAPIDNNIKIEFMSFHLAPCSNLNQTAIGYTNCDCDFVEIKDGIHINSLQIGKYCGHTLPPQLISSSNTMSIRISTDGETTSSGFQARLTKEHSLCGQSVFNISSKVQKITTPGYGLNNIPRGIRCVYHLQSENSYDTIHIKIKNFDLKPRNLASGTRCDKDKLIITSKPEHNNQTTLNKDFVLNNLRDNFFGHENFWDSSFSYPERFEICDLNNHTDFHLQGTVSIFIETSPEQDSQLYKGVELEAETSGFCVRNYTETNGRIRISVQTPKRIHECYTLITAPENHTISVYFLALVNYYLYDESFLDCFDGNSTKSPRLVHFTSNSQDDKPLFSTGRFLLFHYYQTGDTGMYDLNYVTSDKGRGCGGRLNSHVGRITSPLYPEVYRRRSSCEWELQTPPSTRLLLHFAAFDLGRGCDTNYLELRDRSGKTISTFCSEFPADYKSQDNYVKVVFITDMNNSGVGWVADFVAIV